MPWCVVQNPSVELNPEQTASLFSLIFYTFLERIIWTAYRTPHLSFDELPPQCDYDRAKYLNRKTFPVRNLTISINRKTNPSMCEVFGSVLRCKTGEYVLEHLEGVQGLVHSSSISSNKQCT